MKISKEHHASHILLVLGLWLVGASYSSAAGPTSQKTPINTGDYVGADTCSDCHFAEFQQLQKTAMGVLLTKKYPVERRGCEACHGPGRAHAEAQAARKESKPGAPTAAEAIALIYSFTRHSPKENAERCLSCHQKDEKESLFHRSRHLGAGVSCTDCHDPHRLNGGDDVASPRAALETYFAVPKRSGEREWLDNRLLRQTQPALCYSCHQDVQAEFNLPVRHRVNEGLVKCTDCHNPHGTLTPRELKATGTEACFACHVEKKGPFVYEHASVLVEGCTGCHTPHGSINIHLLKRRQERQLCLECHVSPQAVNVPHPRLGFQAAGECTRCHVEIHGSNYQPQFLR